MTADTADDGGRIRVALVNDYDVVVLGLARILEHYDDRLVIAEIDTNRPVADVVDLVLYDSFAQPESDRGEIADLVAAAIERDVVVTSLPGPSAVLTALAVSGLLELGYTPIEAERLLEGASGERPEDLISHALRAAAR